MQSRKKVSPEIRAKIVRLYKETDLKASALAKRFDVHSWTINNILRENGVRRRNA